MADTKDRSKYTIPTSSPATEPGPSYKKVFPGETYESLAQKIANLEPRDWYRLLQAVRKALGDKEERIQKRYELLPHGLESLKGALHAFQDMIGKFFRMKTK